MGRHPHTIFWHNHSVPSTSGLDGWEPRVQEALRRAGYDVILPGDYPPDFSKIDVAFFYWRWLMSPVSSYVERNLTFVRQFKYIEACRRHKVRVVVFDGDHKLSEDLALELWRDGVELYAPELAPRPLYSKLMYPSFPANMKTGNRPVTIGYVGNNYERYDQAVRLLGGPSGPECHFWGDWIEGRVNREPKTKVMADFPNSVFHGILPEPLVHKTLETMMATIHLAKASYCATGFITMRWAEAAAAGVLAFIPSEFAMPLVDRGIFPTVGSVSELNDLLAAYSDYRARSPLLTQQSNWVHDNMRMTEWLRVLGPKR